MWNKEMREKLAEDPSRTAVRKKEHEQTNPKKSTQTK